MSNNTPGYPQFDDGSQPPGGGYNQPPGAGGMPPGGGYNQQPGAGGMPPYPGGAYGDPAYSGYGGYGAAPGGPPRLPLSVGSALSWAWDAIKANPVVLLVGFGIWTLLRGVGANFEYTVDGVEHSYGFVWGMPISLVANLLAPIVVAHVCLVVASGRRATFADFVAFPNFGQALLASILSALAVTVGIVLCILPGIIIAFLLSFAIYVVVDRGTSATEAMRSSFQILSSNTGELVPFALVGFALILLGSVTIIGWIVTAPLVYLMSGYAYLRIQGRDVVRWAH